MSARDARVEYPSSAYNLPRLKDKPGQTFNSPVTDSLARSITKEEGSETATNSLLLSR